MDFDQLVTFLEVAKLGSFSRAGQKVFRSQSAVSAQIRQMEQEYGDRLLDRSGKDVSLTPAGRVLFAYAERLLQLRDESLLAVADQGSTPRGTLVIGANEATCLYVLPDVFAKFRRRNRDSAGQVPQPEGASHLSRSAHGDGESTESFGQA
jgi:DNA-binding transcriptional LysR family regulator